MQCEWVPQQVTEHAMQRETECGVLLRRGYGGVGKEGRDTETETEGDRWRQRERERWRERERRERKEMERDPDPLPLWEEFGSEQNLSLKGTFASGTDRELLAMCRGVPSS